MRRACGAKQPRGAGCQCLYSVRRRRQPNCRSMNHFLINCLEKRAGCCRASPARAPTSLSSASSADTILGKSVRPHSKSDRDSAMAAQWMGRSHILEHSPTLFGNFLAQVPVQMIFSMLLHTLRKRSQCVGGDAAGSGLVPPFPQEDPEAVANSAHLEIDLERLSVFSDGTQHASLWELTAFTRACRFPFSPFIHHLARSC